MEELAGQASNKTVRQEAAKQDSSLDFHLEKLGANAAWLGKETSINQYWLKMRQQCEHHTQELDKLIAGIEDKVLMCYSCIYGDSRHDHACRGLRWLRSSPFGALPAR